MTTDLSNIDGITEPDDDAESELRRAARVAGVTPVDALLAEIAARRMELLKEAA